MIFILVFSTTGVVAQKTANENQITINSVIKDENGHPIKGAIVYGNEGAIIEKSDDEGKFKITIPDQTDLLIESEGYESAVFKAGEINNRKLFSLKTSLFQYGIKDDVNIAFGKVKKGDLVNAVSVFNPGEILEYDNIQDITQALLGRIPGMMGSYNIRGIGAPLYIVDGIPSDINTINLAEVDQVSVLKDINSSILYGNAAVNGVVMITTKRGQAYKKQINISGYYGVSAPKSLPKYLSSADYMELYNEARVNDGLSAPYDTATISKYRSGNPYRYPNVDYYSKDNLKSVKPFFKLMTELSGGNDVTTYYTNVGWEQTGSLFNFGEGESAKQNTFNVRGNVDIKVNPWIKSSIDAVANFNNSKGPRGYYWSEAATQTPNSFSPLIPISLINPDNTLLKAHLNDVNGKYLLGGTSGYLTNEFANGYSGGENENIQRTFSFNNRIDFDLNKITKGLAFHTNFSFDFYTEYDQSINNSYAVYQPLWDSEKDSIISLTKYGVDKRTGVQNVSDAYYERRFGFYGMFDYDRTFGGVHHVVGSLIGYGNKYKSQGDFQGDKNANISLRMGYIYNKKYLLDFSSAYVNSPKLPEGDRGAYSPSLGLAWVISSEKFMSSVTAVDYLKLKVSGGIINSDSGIGDFYLYDNVYSTSGTYSWDDGSYSNSQVVSSYGSNNGLQFEKRKELNLGFESLLFNRNLSIDGNVFTSLYYDKITRPTTFYPSFYSDYIPYRNYDSNSYKGAELGLSFKQSFGDFSFVIGGNALYSFNKVVKKNEIYLNQYQYRTGRPIDAIFGLVADGFFNDQADIDSHAIQSFGAVKPGDIKYVDQNNDGIINTDDEVKIGRWQSPFSYGLNIKLSYKNFTLFAHGNGGIGGNGVRSNSYYWVDGADKYSEIVLNRWTEATKATATFPRLTSLSNVNNFRTSTFWQYKNNYFNVDRLQLSYTMPDKINRVLKMKNLVFHVDATNLITLSKFKDIKELSIGSEPYYRSFSLGIKTTF